MRFLFCDRILELEPGRRVLSTKSVSMGDGFLGEHFGRRPVMPATLMMEALAQVAGWLHIVTEDFAVRTVLGKVEGVRIVRHARPGDTLLVEAWLEYRHRGGASLRGEIRVGDQTVMTASRMVFASEPTSDPEQIARTRELFAYVGGDVARPQGRA